MQHFINSSLCASIFILMSSSADSQWYEPSASTIQRFNESNAIGPATIDESNFYCYWPDWTVMQSTITAVELSTGNLLWTKHDRIALPPTFRAEDGWFLYESTDGEQIAPHRTDGLRTLHIVDRATGNESLVPFDPERNSVVDRPRVHRNRCVTSQGMVINCADGVPIGDLGPGEHQAFTDDGQLYVSTLLFDDLNLDPRKRTLRRFDIETMQCEAEVEVPLDTPWTPVAAKREIVIGRSEAGDRSPQLVCVDFRENVERWRILFPRAIRTTPCSWEGDSKLVLTIGMTGLIWPMLIDVDQGKIEPAAAWRDPQSILAWYNEGGLNPDLIATTDKLYIGRWRLQQLICVDAQTGKVIWKQHGADYLISRLFFQKSQLGDYFVAESEKGFDVIQITSGERRRIVAGTLGLEASTRKRKFAEDEENETDGADTATILFGSKSMDWIWDWGLFAIPAIPALIWIVWSLVLWQQAIPQDQKKIV